MLAAASAVDVLESVRDAPAWQSAEPFERQRRARSVPRESLAPEIVAGFDAHACVHVEAIAFDDERGRVGALVGGAMPVVSCAPSRGIVDTLPRPMAIAAQASSAVCAGGSFERASSGESST